LTGFTRTTPSDRALVERARSIDLLLDGSRCSGVAFPLVRLEFEAGGVPLSIEDLLPVMSISTERSFMPLLCLEARDSMDTLHSCLDPRRDEVKDDPCSPALTR